MEMENEKRKKTEMENANFRCSYLGKTNHY